MTADRGKSVRRDCRWCAEPFTPHRRGSPQEFCSKHCRLGFHAACRTWGAKLVEAGLLPISALKEVTLSVHASTAARTGSVGAEGA